MTTATYQIKLPQFEGPFDLLLFFIERDELDIYNIPIHRITREFLTYIQAQERLNIELSSEFILFVSTLIPGRNSWIKYWNTSGLKMHRSKWPIWRLCEC
jgi:hypothetical protein